METGSYDNVVVIRKGSTSEVISGIERTQSAIVEMLPQIAVGTDGRKMVAKEVVVLIALPKISTGKVSNVTVRGISHQSFHLRPQVNLSQGRLPKMGSMEIVVGRSVARGFQGIGLNETITWGMRSWRVVGIFDAGNTGFSSEIWADVDQVMQAFRRPVYSSLIFKLRDSKDFSDIKSILENDPRLTLEAKRETRYYLDQSEMMARFLRILGLSLTILFSLGAMIGAMNTMYSAVANRTNEIGTLRALGYQRRGIMLAFLTESLILGATGGIIGIFFASFMQFITISTVNFQTFSELAFSFILSIEIVAEAIAFALIMGFIGGIMPAIRASRMNIVDALRA